VLSLSTPAVAQVADVGTLPPPALAAASAPAPAGEAAEPGRLRLFLDDTVLSPSLAARSAFGAALDAHAASRRGEPVDAGDYGRMLAQRAGRSTASIGARHATAALLRLDPPSPPRPCECRHPMRRIAHVVKRTFVLTDSRGRHVPNTPLFAGAISGASVAMAWAPPEERRAGVLLRGAGLAVVGQLGANLFREFSGDLKRLRPGRPRPPE
jgi:hypothetical protein